MENSEKPRIINLLSKVKSDGSNLTMKAWCLTGFYRSKRALDTSKVSFGIRDNKELFSSSFLFRKGIPLPGGFRLNHYKAEIPVRDVLDCDVQNKIIVFSEKGQGSLYYSFGAAKKGTGQGKRSEVFFHDDICYFLRQTRKNTVYLTVREKELFDLPEGVKLIDEAYSEAESLGPSGNILMYEKHCSRYEESASVLFEKLIDLGYENVFYILDRKAAEGLDLPEKYKSHILWKNSPEHIREFFRCSTFIGTETVGHALQLRASDQRIIMKVQDPDIRHIFLQHGVMYMVSLDSEMRAEFRSIDRKLYRTVVSSRKEADHFVELGGFDREDLYVTGLAKFDKSYKNPGADRIAVMLTWRRWEMNSASVDFTETTYYRFLERILAAIPEEYLDKVMILPHPLMKKYIAGTHLSDYTTLSDASYDELLRDCDLLITDYSSIAYDAFYRGSKVIFCWEELDECMERYGGAHLMLDEQSAFGDVCYDVFGKADDGLGGLVRKNYLAGQTDENISKYRKIVEFSDGKNTDRIVECLKKDGIIE